MEGLLLYVQHLYDEEFLVIQAPMMDHTKSADYWFLIEVVNLTYYITGEKAKYQMYERGRLETRGNRRRKKAAVRKQAPFTNKTPTLSYLPSLILFLIYSVYLTLCRRAHSTSR